jgi:hypothetical protein
MDLNMGNSKGGGRETKLAIAGAILIVIVAVVAALYEQKETDNVDLSTGKAQVAGANKVRNNPTNSIMLTLPERAKGAEVILTGRVTNVTSFYEKNAADYQIIATKATISVNETVKGTHQPTIEIYMVGGTVDGLTMRSSKADEPLKVGEQALVMLQNSSGKMRVLPGEGNMIRHAADGKILDAHGNATTLSELKTKIKNAQ